MIEGAVFIGAVIIAATQLLKELFPEKVNGAVTIGVAVVLGLLVALIDKEIGVVNLSPAEGILTGLGAVGVVTTAEKVGKK